MTPVFQFPSLAIRAMRPRQWLKNVVIFVPITFDRRLFVPADLVSATIAFLSFSLAASAVYIINDLMDREHDRSHPTKRFRPIAAGLLSTGAASTIGALALGASLMTGAQLSPSFALLLGFYVAYNIVYTLFLKHVVLVDVYMIALGFVIRVVAGAMAVNVTRFSPWMYLFAGFGSLFIAFGKRRAQLTRATDAASERPVLAEYNTVLLDQALVLTGSISLTVYALYTFSAPSVKNDHGMMLSIVPISFSLLRCLYLISVKGLGESPERLIFADRPLFASVLVWLSISFFELYLR